VNAAAILHWLHERGIAVSHLCADSRRVRPGDVFVALPGATVDGRDFILDAVVRGAAAVIADDTGYSKVGADGTALIDIKPPLLWVSGLAAQCGELAAAAYGHPSRAMWLAGVTGTNGKTSVSQWIAQAQLALGKSCAVIGTLGNGVFGALQASANTTPDALSLHALLADFRDQKVTACAMEVSSIGLEQGRASSCDFAVAIFTNLTRDHLDYHGDMASYAASKAKLFAWPGLRHAVVNGDDVFGRELAANLPPATNATLYALDAANVPADWRGHLLVPQQLSFGGAGIEFLLHGVPFAVPVVGRFNASNVLAVIGALLSDGHALPDIAKALTTLTPPPGRMEALGGNHEPLIVVDYAHTPDALQQALQTLQATAAARGGQLVCVFGCGGDRDPGKRPQMGAIAEQLADVVWVTSDNPRSESPANIIEQILAGMHGSAKQHSEADRGAAILGAVRESDECDVILIAGKGHEPYQEVLGVRTPFSDREHGKSALAARHSEGVCA
jgi:UDP-N-acetylmuramoyl-L-alanyl-D-glutamate--2,6-diaminopimelate ligase